MGKTKKKAIWITLILLITLWIVYFINRDFFQLDTLFSNLENIQNFISLNYLFSIFMFIILYAFLILCNFPMATLLSLISGFLFGTWVGGLIAIVGGTSGAFGIFIIAKYFFSDFIKKNILNKYSYIENYFKKNDLELMILIRIIPGVPFFAQNLILAGLGADSKKLFYTTLLGLTPWSFIFASVGQGLEEIFINQTKISLSLVAKPEYLIPIGIIASLMILFIFFRKKFKN
jgi:uncharacterized membrane protein YdjX (TVP38/TMEM64 family)